MNKDGLHATYKNKQYKCGRIPDTGMYYLIGDESDYINGFEREKDGRYIKYVYKSDLTDPFDIRTWAKYKGKDFEIFSEKDNQYILYGDYIDKNLGFTQTGWGDFTKLVDKDDIDEVYQKVRPLELV